MLVALTVSHRLVCGRAWLFFLIAELLVVLACREYAALARSTRAAVPAVAGDRGGRAHLRVVRACWHLAAPLPVPLDLVLLTSFVTIAAMSIGSWSGSGDAVASVAAAACCRALSRPAARRDAVDPREPRPGQRCSC